ncbi:MAG: FAD-binding oxidoreductase [Sphingomicrobium sp.]
MDRISQMLDAAEAVLGPAGVIRDGAAIEPWLSDWRGRFHGRSAAILAPVTSAEVAAVVRLASEHGVPLVPQGGNTGMCAGAIPPDDGSAVLLSLRRMNRIRRIDPAARIAVVEAGVVLQTLHEAVAEQAMRFPLTLGAKGSCTIGGLISTNAGGTQVLRFGTMRALVAGIEAVLPDGSIHDGLGGLRKDNRGYSIDQLLIGAEGTLGVVTAAVLRLVPAIAERVVAWAGVATPQQALALLRFLEARTSAVEGFELIPEDSLRLVIEHVPGTRAPLAGSPTWHVLIEATSADAGTGLAGSVEGWLGEAMGQGLITDAIIAASEAQAAALWRIRDSISEAERAEGPTLAHDISVAVEAMPDFIVAAAQQVEAAWPGAIASAFGHLGDGNVHFHVRAGNRDRDDFYGSDGIAITRLVDDLVTAAGGSISAEHGIGQMKREEFGRLAPPGRIAALRAIKAALDPRGIMNPGKLLP